MRSDRTYRGLLAALVLSGAAALVYETVWAKLLSYSMGGTTQTVSLILAAFMGGMAIGSWVAGSWADRHGSALLAYAAIELALAVLGATMPAALERAGEFYLAVARGWPEAGSALLALHPVLPVGAAFRIGIADPVPVTRLLASVRDRIEFARDDPNATVVVQLAENNDPPIRYLRVSGKVDASTGAEDRRTQALLAHLPLLLAPESARVLVIGLGSGATAGAALAHPVRELDVVEISSGVIEAMGLFAEENLRFWEDRRTRILLDDARHHLAVTPRTYDVVISEPSNPWMAGVGNLYTAEFFRSAASRLAAAGVFCQWIHTYEMDERVLGMIVRTFQDAFPHVRGFLAGAGMDLLLVGRRVPIAPRPDTYEAAFRRPGVASSLARIRMRQPLTPLVTEAFDAAEAREFFGEGPRITDDRPLLEYEAPRAQYRGRTVRVPIAENLGRPARLWRRLAGGRPLAPEQLAEALVFTRGILPPPARCEWLAALVASGRAGDAERSELASLGSAGAGAGR
jgi:spermidine synthase